MELWDQDAIDLAGPAFIEFGPDNTGSFRFIAVEAWMDVRPPHRDGLRGVEFTWDGYDEGDRTTGRAGSSSTLATTRASWPYLSRTPALAAADPRGVVARPAPIGRPDFRAGPFVNWHRTAQRVASAECAAGLRGERGLLSNLQGVVAEGCAIKKDPEFVVGMRS